MDPLLPIVALLIGLAVGAFVALRMTRRAQQLTIDAALAQAGAAAGARLAAAEARLASREGEVQELGVRLQAATAEARAVAASLADERVTRARFEAELREERERTAEKVAAISLARDELTAHFKALAGDALEANRLRIAEHQHGALDQILKPLASKLEAFEKKVGETYDKEAQQRASLRQEVLNLQAATLRINEDARNLTQALKGEAKTRGNWGEVVLERVLERSGLIRDREYHAQPTIRGEDGSLLRPDIVVRLPDTKHVVIDSKVSLVAYDSYYAAVDDVARGIAGKQHVESMRRHARALGEKNYQTGKEVDSPDFVAMFVPIEAAFSLASSLDADLFLDAWERKVVIVTPSTLLALLMTVQSLWQRDKQTRNAIEIAEQSGALHDQFVLVIESLQSLGRELRSAQKAFDETEKRLVDGRGNLVARVKRLQDMGARTKRQLPADLVERADDTREFDETASGPPVPVQSKLTLVGGDGEPR